MMSPTALGHLEDLVEYLKREATVERRTLLRKAITDELGLSDATQDDILHAIRELRANGAEDARQLKEAQDKYSDQLEEARVEYARSRADCDARCERLTASWLTESHECRRLQQQLDRLRR